MKHKNHDKIASRNEKMKTKHLERLATKMLDQDEKMQKLGELKMKKDIFKFFK